MRDQNNIPNENSESWDDGTYQTGATPDRKSQSGLITGLLIATIFLGGIASALGVMNIRLLQQLGRQNDPVLPVSVDGTGGSVSNFLRQNQQSVPKIPEDSQLELETGTSTPVLSQEELLSQMSACMASVTVLTGQGEELTGPALILSSDGYLLANAHLTANASSVAVRLPGGEVMQAAVVGSDAYSDLALLYVQAQNLTPASFENPALSFAPGKESYVLDETGGLCTGALLAGDITQADGGMRMMAVGTDTLVLELTDFGKSAGPVWNTRGQVRGFLCRPLGCEEGGWMMPAVQLMDIATQLAETGMVSGRPYLGLQTDDLSNFCRQYWNLEHGLEVAAVTEGSAAWESGLLEGDILRSLNGRKLTDSSQFFELLLNIPAGHAVTLEVFRAGVVFTITLPVTTNP